MATSNFRSLEATNRRETVLLVIAFMLLLGALGLGLDIAANDVAIVNGHLVGFPDTDYCGAGFRRRAIDGVLL